MKRLLGRLNRSRAWPIGMRSLRLVLAVLLGAGLAGLSAGRVQAQAGGDALTVPAGAHVAGSIATVSRDIRVDGVVDGDVTSWGGSITIAGSVGGDVVSYGGAVTILATGRVYGHVLAAEGALRREAGAQVAGQIIQSQAGGEALASLIDLVAPDSGAGSAGAAGRVLLSGTAAALLAAACLLFGSFWPRRMHIATATLAALTLRSTAVGLLTTLALGLALPLLGAILSAAVLGIPLLLLLLVLLLAGYAYALAVVAQLASTRLRTSAAAQRPGLAGPTVGVVAALVLLLALVTIVAPVGGLVLLGALASPGLGAVILSRGGMILPLAARAG